MSDTPPSISEVRYQWVEFMCTFAGLGKKRYYEDLFDEMLLKHNRQVCTATLEAEARTDRYDRPCEDRLLEAADRYRKGEE